MISTCHICNRYLFKLYRSHTSKNKNHSYSRYACLFCHTIIEHHRLINLQSHFRTTYYYAYDPEAYSNLKQSGKLYIWHPHDIEDHILHREDGPAVENHDDEFSYYFLKGKRIEEKAFKKYKCLI